MKPFKKSKVESPEISYRDLVAKKSFKIVHNDYVREIKPGDDLSDVPEIYHENLKSEQVL